MLIYRILTAIILIPLVLVGIFLSADSTFVIIMALIGALASWEWSGLIPIQSHVYRGLYVFLFLVFFFGYYQLHIPETKTLLLASVLWIWAGLAVVFFAKNKGSLGWGSSTIKYIFGIAMLVIFAFCVLQIRNSVGSLGLLFGLCMVWASDTGAYFVGKKWGKHRLAERVSPKKSWEGVWGGAALAVMVYLLFVYYAASTFVGVDFGKGVITVLCIVIAAIFGDLFESMLKREINVKDSGHLLPGHGGILDRIDALLAALPIFAILVKFFG